MIDASYVVGQGVRFTVSWTDEGSVVEVEEPVTLRVRQDGGSITDYTMTRVDDHYATVVTFPTAGVWHLRAQTAGVAPGVVEDSVRVRASEFV